MLLESFVVFFFSYLVLNLPIFPRANLKNDANGKHVRLASLDSPREAGKISQLEIFLWGLSSDISNCLSVL